MLYVINYNKCIPCGIAPGSLDIQGVGDIVIASLFTGFNFAFNEKFEMFSLIHIIFLLIILSMTILILYCKDRIKNKKTTLYLRNMIITLLLVSEVSKQIVGLLNGTWSVRWSLPLHLCGISSIVCIIMLINKSYVLFEIMYFWCLVGSPLALLFPDLNVSYRNVSFWAFMISHSMNIIAVVYMMALHKYRPSLGSVKKTFLFTNIYMVFIAGFNYIAGSNYYYFYLCRDPSPNFANPFKTITSWPVLLFLIEIATLILLAILYLPYYIKDYNREKKDLSLKEST